MASKDDVALNKTFKKPPSEEDLFASPEESSDEEDHSADIRPSVFSRPEEDKPEPTQIKALPPRSTAGAVQSIFTKRLLQGAGGRNKRAPRSQSAQIISSTSIVSSSSPKRKSEEGTYEKIGAGIASVIEFDGTHTNDRSKKPKIAASGYGKKPGSQASLGTVKTAQCIQGLFSFDYHT
jgi:hypothetical protein